MQTVIPSQRESRGREGLTCHPVLPTTSGMRWVPIRCSSCSIRALSSSASRLC